MQDTNSNGGSPSKPAPPLPPEPPGIDDCCRSGCTPCVFDLYEEAMERYRIALAAYQKQWPDATTPHRPRESGDDVVSTFEL